MLSVVPGVRRLPITKDNLDTFGRVPEDWYFQSERAAIAFYGGDAVAAAILEATPELQPLMYSSACDMIARYELLADAVGMVPDLAGARTVAGLQTTDLAQVLEIPHATIVEWDRGRRPLPAAAAVSLCKAFRWPLAMLFRSRTGWYPRTKSAMEGGDSELPF